MPNAAAEQSQRRAAIRRLLEDSPATTQQSLVDALTEQGLVATQSSVSRDLREMGAVKTGKGYELPGAREPGEGQRAEVGPLRRSIRPAGPNLLVIGTAIGAAQRVALALDRSNWPEMIGNIGGDDTVFVATETAFSQKQLIAKIERAARA